MTYTVINGIYVWGEPLQDAVMQMHNVLDSGADYGILMADHHLGYSVPVGGVVAYLDKVSPSGVGYDIACGNKAVRLDVPGDFVIKNIDHIMDEIFHEISFGVGRKNSTPVAHPLFDSPTWDLLAPELFRLAQDQLGTVGSGNHFVDVFVDSIYRVWVGVHFGSRGLGHKIATHFIKAGGGKDGIHVAPVTFFEDEPLGEEYIACMKLAGQYAYAGRDWVCQQVANIIGGKIVEEVHNNHNYAWEETHFGLPLWVVRKGATPAFPGQRGFIGGSMGDNSYIVQGKDSPESAEALYSTVHGAGRAMSRTQAAGKFRWKGGQRIQTAPGQISRDDMNAWLETLGIALRGAGTDEAPQAYKRIDSVLSHHLNTIDIIEVLKPIGVAMAGANEYDPFAD